jgi:hypothetical protein
MASLGCAPQPNGDGLVEVVERRPDAEPIAPALECVVATGRDPAFLRDHLPACSAVDYVPHPPAAGPHYAVWADFARYDAPIPWGFLVHAMEHGAVVLVRSCDADACPEVVDAFERIHEATDDPACREHPNGNRVIRVYDPSVEVPVAAVAWGHVYRATCLDEASLRSFVRDHYAQAPENLCVPGEVAPVCP